MSPNRSSFDWVSARLRCNVNELFGKLKAVVKADVESANRNVENAERRFRFNDGPAISVFSVTEGKEPPYVRMVFELVQQKINVHHQSTEQPPHLVARAALSADSTECLLDVECLQPMPLWQFSRRALEDLFFAGR